MSENSLTLNGENTNDDAECTTDSTVMVVALQDHITCAKPTGNAFSQVSKSEGTTYACQFDHMYANFNDNMHKVPNEDSVEVKHLKELLLRYLDLIQQQSDDLFAKERQIGLLTEERDMLRLKLERSENRPVSSVKNTSTSEISMPPDFSAFSNCVTTISKTPIPPFPLHTVVAKDTATATTTTTTPSVVVDNTSSPAELASDPNYSPPPSAKRRKRRDVECTSPITNNYLRNRRSAVSWTSTSQGNDCYKNQDSQSAAAVENDRCSRPAPILKTEKVRGRKPKQKAVVFKKEVEFATSHTGYYTPLGDVDSKWTLQELDPLEQLDNVESGPEVEVPVPSWRIRPIPSGYSMEGTENLGDEIFIKRHQRPEISERRRKRWDAQRIREQRHTEKLRRRQLISLQNQSGDSPRRRPKEVNSLWPRCDSLQGIEVTQALPIAAFGVLLPRLEPSEFALERPSLGQGYQYALSTKRKLIQ